jgi:hypothetical protein
MLRLNRIIRKDASTLVDLSREMSDFLSQMATLDIVAATDKIYIGSDLPLTIAGLRFRPSMTRCPPSRWISGMERLGCLRLT